jgi:hypothetical protein
VCDSVEWEEVTTVASEVTWRLEVAVELIEDSYSREYMKV